nr:MAG TPA: hypothetical protein [Caudoviricetes sp.]
MKEKFMGFVKKYLESCVAGNERDRAYYLGCLQGVTTASLWYALDDYEFYCSEMIKAISLTSALELEVFNKFCD